MTIRPIRYWLLLIFPVLVMTLAGSAALAQPPPQPVKPGLMMRLVTSDYSNPVNAGTNNPFQIVLSNAGDGPVTNISLTSFQPRDWVVELNPAFINQIPVNGIQTVDVNVRPPENVKQGYQNISVTAQGLETSAILDIGVNVQGGRSIWLWIGIGVAVVVLAGFVLVFLRMGRQ